MPKTKRVKTDKISIKDFGQMAMFDNSINDYVRNSISIQDEHSLIQNVVSNCFDGFEYIPRYKHISFATNILVYFCNIEYEKIEDICEFIYNENNLLDKVLCLINKNQLSNIQISIDETIRFRKQVIISQLSKNGSEMELLENINDCITLVRNALNNVSNLFGNEDMLSALKTDGLELIKSISNDKEIPPIKDNVKKTSQKRKPKVPETNIIPLNRGDNVDKK